MHHISTQQAQSHEVQPCVTLFIFGIFYILFCKGLEMMGSDKIHTASCTYVHVLSSCHLYPLPVT
jgi:hypothetical protein